jgi:hypothetical protein
MKARTLHRFTYRFPVVLLVFLAEVGIPLHAQNANRSQRTEEVMLSLRKDMTAYLSRTVLPALSEFKQQFDASLKSVDLARIESLRKQSHELLDRIDANEREFAKARRVRDFRRALDFRSRLEGNFETRRRLLGEAQRIGTRSGQALPFLQARLDSAKEEWKAGAVRIFIDWFARNQSVIRPILSDDSDQALVDFMSAAKDLRLEETAEHAILYFLLWDGSDFVPAITAGDLPETPLSRTGPSRERSILFDTCSPSTFATSTTLRFTLPVPGRTRIQVFDSRGRPVTTLVNEDLPTGRHTTTFSAEKLSPGTYFFLLTCRDLSDVQVAQLSR